MFNWVCYAQTEQPQSERRKVIVNPWIAAQLFVTKEGKAESAEATIKYLMDNKNE